MKYLIFGIAILFGLVMATNANAETTKDHFKTVFHKTPHYVEVCYDKRVSGDKTGDTLKGAILGGVIGNNVGNVENGGAIGAIIGGMLGHNNSNATGGTKTICQTETRYTEEKRTIYSHSTVTFMHEGKSYTLRFQK